jgi:hypothetical protein
MESLRSNKPLLYSILFSFSLVISLIFNLIPQLTEQFQIVLIPDDVREFFLYEIEQKTILLLYLDATYCFLCCNW